MPGLLEQLAQELTEGHGIGIAAPQIGENIQVAMVRTDKGDIVLVNPRLIKFKGVQSGWEGCLSVPDLVGWVDRPQQVEVEALDGSGKLRRHRATGLYARAMVHELDHLAGVLYTDTIDPTLVVDTRIHPTPIDIRPLQR